MRTLKHTADKNLTAYTSTSGSKKAFTVKKGKKVTIYSFYKKEI
ncbi:hypothetical protein [Terrisporobacter petrolearius]